MKNATSRKANRQYRHKRVRRKVKGTAERPRLCVYKSLNYLYVQVVDDDEGKTLLSATTRESGLLEGLKGSAKNMAAAERLGETVAKRATEKGIKSVIFDRGGCPYHGKLKALADAARKGGLEF